MNIWVLFGLVDVTDRMYHGFYVRNDNKFVFMFFWGFFGRWYLTHKHSLSIYVVLFLSLYVCVCMNPSFVIEDLRLRQIVGEGEKIHYFLSPSLFLPMYWVTVCVCDSVCVSNWEPMHEHFFHSQNQWSCKHSHSENPSLSLPLLVCFLNDSITESIVS